MRLALPLWLLVVTAFPCVRAADAPERTIDGTTVVSLRDPAVRVSVPKTATYVGAERFVLFDVADCEIHLFVEADSARNVQRLYWVQFEGYLPSLPDRRYQPSAAATPTTIAGKPFNVRARFGRGDEAPQAGSDGERMMRMLAARGYTLPVETQNARFIHYLDDKRRRELMVIVLEDLAPTGHTVAELSADGKVQPAWAPLGEALVERAKRAVKIEFR